MKKRIYIFLLLAIPLSILAVNGDFVNKLMQQLKLYNINYPQESVYVQTDKTFYKQTENIWYKIYLVDANNKKSSTTSDIVHIELRDPKGTVLEKREHYVIDGVCDGEFLIKEDAVGGLYTLTAYTNWMKNWGDEVLFKKEINVQKVITPRLLLKMDFMKRAYGPGDEVEALLTVSNLRNEKTNGSSVKSTVKLKGKTIQTLSNTVENGEVKVKFNLPTDLDTSDGLLQIVVSERGIEESISRSIPIVLNKIAVQFFPEGGHIVQNTKNKIAFESLDEFGKGADISGVIVDEDNNECGSFESFHLGMGTFDLTPLANKKYFAKILTPQGSDNLIALPEVLLKGYMLNLKSRTEKSLVWNVYSTEESTVTLVGQTQGKIHFSKQIEVKKGDNKVEVSLNDFPIGVAVFTLFDGENKESCERLVFVNPDKGLHIKIETDKKFYKPEEEVKLTVKTSDKYNKPVPAKLAISVVDEQLMVFADDKQDNMLSYLLFSSELKGKIQEPYFYFDPTQAKAKDAIDYLMLTHGWRRFVWDEVIKGTTKELNNPSEKVGDVYGYVADKNAKPKQTTIYLIELGGKKRVAKTRTTPEGQFAFHNIDLSDNVMIVTKLPNSIKLFDGKPQVIIQEIKPTTTIFTEIGAAEKVFAQEVNLKEIVEIVEDQIILEDQNIDENQMLREFTDNATLDEVVVVGYGIQTKKDLTGAVRIVTHDDLAIRVNNMLGALNGRIPGVIVQPQNVNNEQGTRIFIRGISSFGNGLSQPALVLNGILLSETISGSYDLNNYVNSQDIESISVTKNPSPSSRMPKVNNGIIYITTKKPFFTRHKRHKPKYTGVSIAKREFYQSNRFSQEAHNADKLQTTVYWNGDVNTGKDGKATLKFVNNSTSSSFRIMAEGLSHTTGLIGSHYDNIATTKPFSLDVKTPIFASLGDTVRLPIMVNNSSKNEVTARVKLALPDDLKAIEAQEKEVTIMPESAETVFLSFSPRNIKGEQEYTILAEADNVSDEITRSVTIRSVFFPQQMSLSGRGMEETFDFKKQSSYVEGSFQATVVCYTNTIDELLGGLDKIFSEPHGCFEQTSSTNFPNIMALQALEAAGEDKPEIKERALSLLDRGYKRLASYEVKETGGFEWFGNDPAHTGLSAYGILQFHELQKVYSGVNKDMVQRTHEFILGRKDSKGSFTNNTRGMDQFSGSPQSISDAYITYAFTETGDAKQVEKEYAYALKEAYKSQDMYRMALMANSAYTMGDMDAHNKLIKHFKEKTIKDFSEMVIETTITRSSRPSAITETVALWTLAMLKSSKSENIGAIEKCIEYVSAQRSFGGFYNTQATILCLQALTQYANTGATSIDKGQLDIVVNGENRATLDLSKEVEEGKEMDMDITNLFDNRGDNTIKLSYAGLDKPLSHSINFYWEYSRPASSKECATFLTTKLSSNIVKRNETTRLAITLQNKKDTGIPMNVAIIGIPGGMSLQPWQLKELRDKQVFDYYEIIDDNLVIYYSHMQPNEKKEINLDLKAEIPGTYKGMASSTYVYYTNEHKHWVDGLAVKIVE